MIPYFVLMHLEFRGTIIEPHVLKHECALFSTQLHKESI